uniref:Large ribosomal subunit protein uL4c n=1 Tax=Dicranema revolutum TaxID=239144 RepID=A0A4D6WUU9_9FLOR|nr:ribosomal protein L4 [Dicranema revolutum]
MIEQEIKYLFFTNNNNTEISKTIKLNVSNSKEIYLVHRALRQQLYNKRQGTVSTKTRGKVRGGGKKPWKQKGTGKARVGSIRSPLWRGGGVIFGPQQKIYNIKLNKKEKRLALRNIIYNKSKNTIIVENFLENIESPSTKLILKYINKLNVKIDHKTNVLIIVKSKHHNLYLATRNLQNIELISANQLNTLVLLKANILIITSDALNIIHKVYNE